MRGSEIALTLPFKHYHPHATVVNDFYPLHSRCGVEIARWLTVPLIDAGYRSHPLFGQAIKRIRMLSQRKIIARGLASSNESDFIEPDAARSGGGIN